jgi:hypothetical protein
MDHTQVQHEYDEHYTTESIEQQGNYNNTAHILNIGLLGMVYYRGGAKPT